MSVYLCCLISVLCLFCLLNIIFNNILGHIGSANNMWISQRFSLCIHSIRYSSSHIVYLQTMRHSSCHRDHKLGLLFLIVIMLPKNPFYLFRIQHGQVLSHQHGQNSNPQPCLVSFIFTYINNCLTKWRLGAWGIQELRPWAASS